MNNEMGCISVAQARLLDCGGVFLSDDMALFTKFENVPLPLRSIKMDCLLLALCTSGQATYTVDTKAQVVCPNDLIIITEGQVVGDYMLSRDCKGICIMISNEFYKDVIKDVHDLSSLFLFARSRPVVHFSDEEAYVFTNYFNMINRRVQKGNNPFLRQLTCALLNALLYELGKKIWEMRSENMVRPQSRAEAVFVEFIQLVEQHFRSERKVSWYASRLNITPKYLSEIVKTASRRTPNEWIDQYVTLEIRVLLKNSNMNIKEMTEYMHFPNQSFFGKFFKERVGMSPSEYRRTNL